MYEYVVPGFACVATIGVCSGLYLNFRENKKKEKIISQLLPYIEKEDDKPGISFQNQLDFAERAGIPTHEVIEGRGINFHRLPASQLEKALESYQ